MLTTIEYIETEDETCSPAPRKNKDLTINCNWTKEGPMCTYSDCPQWDKYCALTGAKRKECDSPQACGAIALRLREENANLVRRAEKE